MKKCWILKSSSVLFVLLFAVPAWLQAQSNYLFPVKPGQTNLLSGNYSEIRPNHFHSGIDVKIGGVDGEPILAIEDGYVYRIKLSSFGYGNIVYIKHPNGQSSVYAHLRNFSPKIQEFMRQELYVAEKNELEVFPDPSFLPVKRGEIIGNGGNTGGSGGPHLHFEIRDSLDRAIDPFTFNFKEYSDKAAPVLYKLALKPLDSHARVNGKFQRMEFTPVLEGGRYILKSPVKISGRVGLEVHAIDKMDMVSNVFGVPTFEVSVNGNKHFRVHLDQLDFNNGRFFLTHMHQNRFIRLYRYPNNQLGIYSPDTTYAGAIEARIGEKKEISVLLQDYFGNSRTLKLHVEGEKAPETIGTTAPSPNKTTKVSYERETMIIETGGSETGTLAKVFVRSYEMEIPTAYTNNGRRTYLWDMNFGIPDSIDLCTEVIKPEASVRIPFGEEFSFANRDVEINFADNSLLDDLFLRVENGRNGTGSTLRINSNAENLRNPVEVLLRNTRFTGDKTNTHIYNIADNGRKTFVGGQWESDNIRFKTRNFGTFVLDSDRTKPSISPVRVNSSEMRFIIKDDKSGIKDFEARVNGKWVLMRYEHKLSVIWSEKLDKQPFKGEVLLKVRDQAGNEAVYRTKIQ